MNSDRALRGGKGRGSRSRVPSRAGSRGLSIFTYSLNAKALRAHAGGPLRSSELEETIGWAPQTSLRAAVANLCDLNALGKRDSDGAPKGAITELTPAGRDLLGVADRLERWLMSAPSGGIALDGAAAAGAVKALVAAWDATVVRALAEKPLMLTELNAMIPEVSYPALERRIARLRSTNLIVPVGGRGKGKPYAVTDWLRHAIAPLCAAARWERRHIPSTAEPISHMEVEAAFLLCLPLVDFASRSTGNCTLAVLTSPRVDNGDGPEVAGITIGVRDGEIVSCVSTAASNPRTWALGRPGDWLDAMIDGRYEALRVRGANPDFAQGIVRGFHEVLFPSLGSANLRV